jgi:hypothetical protein
MIASLKSILTFNTKFSLFSFLKQLVTKILIGINIAKKNIFVMIICIIKIYFEKRDKYYFRVAESELTKNFT